MRLAKIKNKYLFESDNPEGVHTYAVYKDKTTGELRAIALTHLYIKDNKRFRQVSKGNIRVEKFREFDVPSGVQNYYYSETVSGKKINLSDKEVKVGKRYLPHTQAERIKTFAKYRYKKNSRK